MQAGNHVVMDHPDGYAHGYTERIVDHGVEREEALRRHEAVLSFSRRRPCAVRR